MKVAVYGNKGFAQYVIQKLIANKIEILAIIDDDNGEKFAENIPIVKLEEFKDQYLIEVDCVILSVSWHVLEDSIKQLQQLEIENLYRIPIYVFMYQLDFCKNGALLEERVIKINKNDASLLYLETHVSDKCNLNCRGCMHFSNIMQNENDISYESFKTDLIRLKQLFDNIFIIRLMGGEPLLNKELDKYLEATRAVFPKADIRIVTNGLLIPNIKNEVWKAIKENYITFDISNYPPTGKMMETIECCLKDKEIPYGIGDSVTKFRKTLTLQKNDNVDRAMKICQSSHCTFLRNGMLARCPLPLLIPYFNEISGANIISKSYWNIYDETRNGQELLNMLRQPADMCQHCPDVEAFLDWEPTDNHADENDWIL